MYGFMYVSVYMRVVLCTCLGLLVFIIVYVCVCLGWVRLGYGYLRLG
jgi:hypothetical protein